jgi:hypothetical protein
MVTYNPEYTEEKAVIEYAYQQKKGVFIKKALSSGHLKDSIQERMKFIFQQPGINSVIVGTLNPAHLQQNADAIEFSKTHIPHLNSGINFPIRIAKAM